MAVETKEVHELMSKCRVGMFVGRDCIHDANRMLMDCYRVLGELVYERDVLRNSVVELGDALKGNQ